MAENISMIFQEASVWAIPLIFLLIVVVGAIRRVKVYEVFVEGAKEGFYIASFCEEFNIFSNFLRIKNVNFPHIKKGNPLFVDPLSFRGLDNGL